MNRHPSETAILRFFEFDHLPEPLRSITVHCLHLAELMTDTTESDPELTVGLRKLLEAKDCFVRAKVAELNKAKGEAHEGKPV